MAQIFWVLASTQRGLSLNEKSANNDSQIADGAESQGCDTNGRAGDNILNQSTPRCSSSIANPSSLAISSSMDVYLPSKVGCRSWGMP